MSTVLKPISHGDWDLQEKPSDKISRINHFSRHRTAHGIRYKENSYKHKCNKALKNKLKKYKLRTDGKEDPDVINVSHIFQNALSFKPTSINNNDELDISDTERPKNYLFKMVRRKKDVESVKSIKTLFKELPQKNIPVDIPFVPTETNENDQQPPNSQEKRHTNAFKLMMESRNKSIGGNSPGKEIPVDEAETQLKIEEKSIKAKRLMKMKMAEQKGSLKKKEKEELLEEDIKRKMDKRAERLTNMIVSHVGKKVKPKEHSKLVTKVVDTILPTNDNVKALTEKQSTNKQSNGALHLINIFDEPTNESNITNSLKEKCVSKEDLEFLKKLSPSIKKKENMLCYFKKIEKDCDSSPPVNTDNNEMSPIIKVKFGARNKKKIKKKKLSLNDKHSLDVDDRNKCEEEILDVASSNTPAKNKDEPIVTHIPVNTKNKYVETNAPTDSTESKAESRKRKREQLFNKINNEVIEDNECLNQSEASETKNGRPKRNLKKPIQYKDDFLLSSSDEEYNIFTPKKKKHDKKTDTPKSIKVSKPKISEEATQSKANNKVKKPAKNNDDDIKSNVKLAPIFAPKPQLDPAALEAKQRFLQSGVPEKLKKIAQQLKHVVTELNYFPTVVHVQQIEELETDSRSMIDSFGCGSPDLSPVKCKDEIFKTILSPEKPAKHSHVAQPDKNIRKVLQNIKQSYPKFPVYRTYQLLKEKSKGELGDCNNFPDFDNSIEIINNAVDINKVQVDKLNWTEKYKPMVTNQIIGNFETTKELKKWLESWSANDDKKKANGVDSDSSDFYYSDTDSKDSVKTIDNLLILTGPTGCGKTSCVYAVATDLAIKVIEVNASSKRNGKIMLQDLQEATQSHKVNRGKGSENSQKSQEIVEVDLTIKPKKRGRPKKTKDVVITKQKSDAGSQSTNSQESTRTGMSLILIDDADIVFDQDDGFCSAISQLVQFSKRPVILVTSSLVCPHLQRFLLSAKILTMKPLLPRMLGTWLDIMCLADSGTCWPGLGAVLLDLYKGDIRKTINCLQFYATTHTQGTKQEENSQNIEALCDETSSMSWAGSDNQDERNLACESIKLGDALWKYFMERQSQLLHIRFPSDLLHVWWNIPGFFMTSQNRTEDDNKRRHRELEEIANIVDNISAADYFGRLRPDSNTNICSQPWYSSECDSSSEFEKFDSYNKSVDLADEISKTFVVRSICNTQKCLQYNEEWYVKPTSMAVQRDRERVVKRHDSISSHLNPGATLDRRALALDYWSSCRAICRFEKEKTDTNSKRNNRFCHYLRSLKIMCKNDVFDKLGESLHIDD